MVGITVRAEFFGAASAKTFANRKIIRATSEPLGFNINKVIDQTFCPAA